MRYTPDEYKEVRPEPEPEPEPGPGPAPAPETGPEPGPGGGPEPGPEPGTEPEFEPGPEPGAPHERPSSLAHRAGTNGGHAARAGSVERGLPLLGNVRVDRGSHRQLSEHAHADFRLDYRRFTNTLRMRWRGGALLSHAHAMLCAGRRQLHRRGRSTAAQLLLLDGE